LIELKITAYERGIGVHVYFYSCRLSCLHMNIFLPGLYVEAMSVLLRDENPAEIELGTQTDYTEHFHAPDYHSYCYCSKKKIKYIRNRPESPLPHDIYDLVAQQEEYPRDK
jgi:hypothetical protein